MSGQLGMSVLIKRLFGDNSETVAAYNGAVGRVIASAVMDNSIDPNRLVLRFTDSTGIYIFDDGQSCCETRYMTTDDDLASFTGATFNGLELREAPDRETEYGEPHEVQFLLINTSKGVFTLETHNEHNGYYGGFAIEVRVLEEDR